MAYQRKAKNFTVGIIEVDFPERYRNKEELIKDFSNGYYTDIQVNEENGDGSYLMFLPQALYGASADRRLCKLFIEGKNVEFKSFPSQKDVKKWIGVAKRTEAEFIRYLNKQNIPYKIL